ncbi:hypothetical protein [Rufibacter psychrotolerans]|uniref:hypothetical protein n=1 Tax=Rufibacter psychrotolerans TaxID=2812556 RepID=UPI0019678A45|nr:hypothetical protein [Rufibacter sp. SYSU D00308]
MNATNDKAEWDLERYRELNGYFRERINQLLTSDPHLINQVAQGQSLRLEEIVESMTLNDQVLWKEFLQLDQMKMQIDIQDHLEGKGTPLDSQKGFYRQHHENEDDEEALW